jgi:hypothetical protein
MFTKSIRSSTRLAVAILSIAALPLASGIAAPPGGGSSTPPVVDIAYMNGSTMRGLQVSASGTASGDVALWTLLRQANLYAQSISWNPDGSWLTWSQDIDKIATHAIVAAQPGHTPTTGLDWSPDGRRLAASVAPLLVWKLGYRSWGTTRIAVGELACSYANGVELVTVTDTNMDNVTSGPPAGQADDPDERPSWGPSSATAACDRVAFLRGGLLTLLDVPRTGYQAADCVVQTPTTISNRSASGLDWK